MTICTTFYVSAEGVVSCEEYEDRRRGWTCTRVRQSGMFLVDGYGTPSTHFQITKLILQ